MKSCKEKLLTFKQSATIKTLALEFDSAHLLCVLILSLPGFMSLGELLNFSTTLSSVFLSVIWG